MYEKQHGLDGSITVIPKDWVVTHAGGFIRVTKEIQEFSKFKMNIYSKTFINQSVFCLID